MNKKYCKILGLNNIYTIENIRNNTVTLSYKNSIVTTDLSNIQTLENKNINTRSVPYSVKIESNNIPNEIMLRHKNKEDAIAELDKYIDQAIVAKLGRVRIIHGRHGGILRNAVSEYLSSHPYIKEFHIADYYEGGIGVTIAIIGKK